MISRKVILIALILFISFCVFISLSWREDNYIEKITVTGNYTIAKADILLAARLKDSTISSKDIDIGLIQDRLMKHPEIKKAFVSTGQSSDLKIEIIEKRPVAILNGENEMKLVDDELDIFPFKNINKLYDLPVISGVRLENTLNSKNKYSKEDLRLALFLILTSYSESKFLYSNISEINLSDTNKIVLYMSEDSSPVYFPRRMSQSISGQDYRNLLTEKLKILEYYIKKSIDKHKNEKINYIDMRFSNQIIVNSNN